MKGFGIPCLLSCLLSSPEPLRFWYGNGQASPIHPSVRRLFTFSNVRQPNVIKFHVKHHQVVGKTVYGFWADWIGTACHGWWQQSSHRHNGKIFKNFLHWSHEAHSLYIIFEPRSDKKDLLAIKVKSEIFTEKERPSCCEQLQKIWRDYLYKQQIYEHLNSYRWCVLNMTSFNVVNDVLASTPLC